MDDLLLEGAARHLEHLESLQRAASLSEPVMVCSLCYVPMDEHVDLEGRHSLSRDHRPVEWPIDQVIIKLKALIRRQHRGQG